jgi:adenylate cyclase
VSEWKKAGMLDGLSQPERRARLQLLEELTRQGAIFDELRGAAAENRLALLPAELALGGRGEYTLGEVAERAGVDEGLLRAYVSALGLAMPREDLPLAGEEDLEAARVLARVLEAGLPAEGLLEAARISGQWLPALAQTMVRMVGEAFLRPGDTELDVARRYRAVAEELRPLLGGMLEHHLTQHLRQAIRSEVLSHTQVASGATAPTEPVAVAFADLSGFTRMGARIPPDELGRIASRLVTLTTESLVPPVRAVKYLGDAAMLVSPDPAALLDTLLRLTAAVDVEGDELPPLHAGAAFGPAVSRAGDWFGHTVNLASRIADVARAGTVVGDTALREAAGDGYVWARLPRRHLRDVPGRVELHRLRGPRVRQSP